VNLVITVKYRSPLWRMWREWWYELLHGCNQLVFNHHPDTYQMGSNHEGIFTGRRARRESDEVEVTIYSWARGKKIHGPEAVQLAERIEAFSKTLDYDKTSVRYRHRG
jgi:hypothetical protein